MLAPSIQSGSLEVESPALFAKCTKKTYEPDSLAIAYAFATPQAHSLADRFWYFVFSGILRDVRCVGPQISYWQLNNTCATNKTLYPEGTLSTDFDHLKMEKSTCVCVCFVSACQLRPLLFMLLTALALVSWTSKIL